LVNALASVILVSRIEGSRSPHCRSRPHPHYTSVQLHTAENVRTSILVIGALIAVGAWLWMDLLISLRAVRAAATPIVGLTILGP